MGGFHDQYGNYRPDLVADAQKVEIDRLRDELAEAKAELDISREAHRMVQSALLSQAAETERVEAELKAMRELLEMLQSAQWLKPAQRKAIRAALNPSPAGPDGRNLAVIYCMERAEEDVKLLREALEGMIAVAEGRFDGNPHADIDALAKARAALRGMRYETGRAEAERDALKKVLHTIWENPTTASWILELIEASGAIAAPQ